MFRVTKQLFWHFYLIMFHFWSVRFMVWKVTIATIVAHSMAQKSIKSYYYPLFRVRSWNNGVRCMSFYILIPVNVLCLIGMAWNCKVAVRRVTRNCHSRHAWDKRPSQLTGMVTLGTTCLPKLRVIERCHTLPAYTGRRRKNFSG